MAMSKKIKQAANKLFSGKTITYIKPKAKPRQVQVRGTNTPKKPGLKHYGEKGYRPSNGIGVGH